MSRLFGCGVMALLFGLMSSMAADGAGRKGGKGVRDVASGKSTRELSEWALAPLPLGSIRPQGWLARQLRIQADGLSGHLDEFWADIRDSGWIGGEAEGWERMPYWLDGVVPLAYLLDDEELKAKVSKHLDYILSHQEEDGWLGPEKSTSRSGNYKPRDPWPLFVMMKVFTQYHEATGDERVIPVMSKFFRCLSKELEERALFDWNRMRWQDGVLTLHWLYERTGEDWLLKLAKTLHEQGYDWEEHFEDLPYKKKVKKWEMESHVVNNAMALKAFGVLSRQQDGEGLLEATHHAIAELDKYHGQVTGVFSGDECFAGKMPSQGTELCAVTEYMFSLEVLAAAFGDGAFGDRLERIAYNALPATFKPDMWAHQYDQQANQVMCRIGKDRVYTTNGADANIFGLEPNYGCCTANMHQGWPKLATHLWMRPKEGGIAAVAYAPSEVRFEEDGVPVTVSLETDYPFGDMLTFTVTPARAVPFPLHLRIPAWAEEVSLTVDGTAVEAAAPGQFAAVDREWTGVTQVTLELPRSVTREHRFNGAVALHYGPLVLSLKISEYWKQVRGELPHADWEVYPLSSWNYALQTNTKQMQKDIKIAIEPIGDVPFSPENSPITVTLPGRQVPEWVLERNAAAPPPESPVQSTQALEELTLIPYGCTNLRVSEFPVLDESK